MSLVVFKGGVMAADSATWQGPIMVRDDAVKVHRTPAGLLIGCVGLVHIIQAFDAWADQGFPEGTVLPDAEEESDFGAFVMQRDGSVVEYDYKMNHERAERPFGAIGYGTEFALGLLVAGLSAKEVVTKAVKHVAYVGGKVTALDIKDAPAAEEVEEDPIVIPMIEESMQQHRDAWREARGIG